MNQKIKSAAVWLPVAVALAFAVGLFVGARMFKSIPSWNTQVKIGEMMNLISSEYVDEVDVDSLLEASIPDIIAKLDPHSVYIPASELERDQRSA